MQVENRPVEDGKTQEEEGANAFIEPPATPTANLEVTAESIVQLDDELHTLNLPDYIVLDCSGFNYIDYMAVNVLKEVV